MFGTIRKKSVILEASSPDHTSIADLHGRSFPRGWSKSEFANLSLQNNVTLLVARSVGNPDGPVLGFNIVRQAEDEAEILSIAVDPKARGRGLGESLMREAILRLRADRIEKLILEVDGSNESAIKLYNKLGFQTVGNRPGYYRNEGRVDAAEPSTALVMRLDLV
ncbi:MAG: ribosomal-protein-alanine N-acetyltransferase [Rhizobiaceae bacterium]|nr:ribosomal-protein-alanine N-acetyltransferase [Rhizobiaceae bacterium]